MGDINIKSEMNNFYNDPLYQELNAYYSRKTIFNILKIERNENRHSAFLAWLLDTKGSHGLGDEPLKKFLRLVTQKTSGNNNSFADESYEVNDLNVSTELSVSFNNQTGRIDIFVEFGYKTTDNKEDFDHVYIIIENKIYTKEHNKQTETYYNWAKETYPERAKIIGVFLSPKEDAKCSCKEFVKITYEDILQNVIEPLYSDMQENISKTIMTDNIVNLGQTIEKKGDDGKSVEDKDTILALSNEMKKKTCKLYEKYDLLLNATLFVVNKNKTNYLKTLYGKERFKSISDCVNKYGPQLESFWEEHKKHLKRILYTALRENYGDPDIIDKLLGMNKSNRNETKYFVKDANDILMTKNKNGVFMSLASYYIFKAWLQDHENATLKELREAFTIEQCASYYSDTFQYLFYKKDDIEKALTNNKTDKTYFIAELDEDNDKTKNAHKYLTWDFYTEGKHNLQVKNDENGKDNVLSIKKWNVDDFNMLIQQAKQYGISVEPA